MKKIIILSLPLLFFAQACDFLFGDLGGGGGSGNRGIFFSTDSGQTWEQAELAGKNKSLAGLAISQIFYEPGQPKNMLAATANQGLYGSEDHGRTWIQLLPNMAVYNTFVNPNNTQEIFAGGARERIATILKSPDRGGVWVQIYSEPRGEASVSSMIFDKTNAANFYAGLSTGTILKSTDFGQTWDALADLEDRVVSLVMSADGRTLFALCRKLGLKRSSNGGMAWTDTDIGEDVDLYNYLHLDSTDSTRLYLGTQKGLFVSGDSGASWHKILLPASASLNDVAAVTVNPQNSRQIYAAIRSTIYRSDDNGQTWAVQTLPTARVISSIVVDPDEPNRLVLGLK